MIDTVRAMILDADPDMIEERKWKKPSNGMVGVPVWSHHGIVCTGAYSNVPGSNWRARSTLRHGGFVSRNL